MAWGWIGWIIIGGFAGWIASKIRGTDAQQGLFLDIVVGIIGGLLGGFLLGLFGINTGNMGVLMSFVTCLIGAVILLWIVQLVTRKR